jgi:hypothetical protein
MAFSVHVDIAPLARIATIVDAIGDRMRSEAKKKLSEGSAI